MTALLTIREGGNADENRSGLLQGDAIRNITGNARRSNIVGFTISSGYCNGAFEAGNSTNYIVDQNINEKGYVLNFNASRSVPTGSENRSINIKIEVWELESINGINIWGE